MKKLFTLFAAVALLCAVGCGGDEYDDSALRKDLTDLANRVAKLEQLCQQMNTNISSLQTIVNALQQNDYITSVAPVTQGGKVIGYTITFSRSGAITIYHGEDGKDGTNGANGKDGYTPQVGVMKDTDGIYYWTVDGEWLLDAKGNKIQAVGTDGKDGEDGTNGSNGKDGITPQLKIENDYWYVSYDNGKTWTQLGKATGADGSDGTDGADGDSIFKSVTQDDEFVYFNLSDGTMITLPKHDKENIQFEDLRVKAICCKHWDTNNDGELSYAEAAAVTEIGTVFNGNTNIIAFTELKYFTGITAIPSRAFGSCSSLWKIIIPENVLSIGEKAFESCESLYKINIPNSVQKICDYVFADCKNLLNIEIGNQLAEIGDYAFNQCSSLTSVKLPNSLMSIGEYAFTNTSLTTIIIPENVNCVGSYAFAFNYNLTSAYIQATTPPTVYGLISDWYGWLFNQQEYCTTLIYVPKASVELYKSALGWSQYADHIYPYDFD
nr:hypothetical protein [Rikenellaceae bacterium]